MRQVGVYRLVTRDSVEVAVLRRAVRKRKLELIAINRSPPSNRAASGRAAPSESIRVGLPARGDAGFGSGPE